MENLEKCSVCESRNRIKFIDCEDFTVSKERFSIVRCQECSFLFTNPRPGENGVGKYYESEEYISHSDTSKGLINKLYHSVREYTLKKKVELVKYSHPGAKIILDYGAGTGEFLNALKKKGFSVNGVEPSIEARRRTKEKFNIELQQEFNPGADTKYDVITMWHVLEHVHSLNELIEKLYSVLDSRGTLIIAVPNCESYDASFYKEHWAAYDVPRHLYHFSQDTMERLLNKHQFSLNKIYPMYFDSFYVSMLSEKYRGNKGVFGLFRAGTIGLLTDILGATDKRKFSSLIYVFKKRS